MTDPNAAAPTPRPPDCNAALVLADGAVFWGRGVGAPGRAVGEVCTNPEDIETRTPPARGLVIRERITDPANYRATQHLDAWLKSHGMTGLSGVDTRRLTRRIRDGGAPNGVIAYDPKGDLDIAGMREEAEAWPG